MAPRSGFLRANCAARCLGRGIGIGAARRRVVAPVDRSRRDDIRPNAVGRQIENLGERRSPSRRVRSRRVTTLGRPWVPRTSASAPDGWPDVGSSGEGREVVLTHPPPRTRQIAHQLAIRTGPPKLIARRSAAPTRGREAEHWDSACVISAAPKSLQSRVPRRLRQ